MKKNMGWHYDRTSLLASHGCSLTPDSQEPKNGCWTNPDAPPETSPRPRSLVT